MSLDPQLFNWLVLALTLLEKGTITYIEVKGKLEQFHAENRGPTIEEWRELQDRAKSASQQIQDA